ncbi:hypothetical protein GCM10022263_02790 [Nocardioides daeguensis]|uniref:Uncharacterized protein n=1 Tax=Nocardioides daeguensis TaxID=908359 RepID=A0ABP6URI8_9ACTN
MNSTKIAAADTATVTGTGRLAVSAAQVAAAKTVSAAEKMTTIGHESEGTRTPGSGRAWREGAGCTVEAVMRGTYGGVRRSRQRSSAHCHVL